MYIYFVNVCVPPFNFRKIHKNTKNHFEKCHFWYFFKINHVYRPEGQMKKVLKNTSLNYYSE